MSSKAITDDQVVQNIKAHIQFQTLKQFESKTSITPKIQPQASKKKNSQVPGPSKIPVKKKAQFNPPVKKSVTCTPPISDSDGDSEVSEEEKYCVCNKFTPEEVRKCTSLIFTNGVNVIGAVGGSI